MGVFFGDFGGVVFRIYAAPFSIFSPFPWVLCFLHNLDGNKICLFKTKKNKKIIQNEKVAPMLEILLVDHTNRVNCWPYC